MKKLVLALLLLLCLPVHAQYTPFALQIFQADVSGTFFWGRNFIPANPASSYFLMYDGGSSQPKTGVIGTGLAWDGTTLSSSVAAQVNSDWNASSGLAQILNKPSPYVFNFGDPTTRTLAVSTTYQASDPSKAAIVTVSPNCTNATTVIAASACTLQVRQSASSGLNCSNGTVASTWTSTYALGLLLTNASGSPIDVKLGIGRYFILCPTAGSFTITTAVDQAVG